MEVKLKRNGWHQRLQKFVFKYPPTFYSFCPYFWITIFCILITFVIPIIPIWKIIKYTGMGIGWLFIKIMDGFNDHICEPAFEWLVKNMPEDDILKAWTIDFNYNGAPQNSSDWYNSPEGTDFLFWRDDFTTIRNMGHKEREKYNLKFQVWKKNTPDWEQRIADMKIRQKEFWLKMAKQRELDELAEAEKERKVIADRIANADKIKVKEKRKIQTMNAIIKYTKWLAYALGIGVIAAVAYGVYQLVDWIYNAVVWYEFWPKFFWFMEWAGYFLGAAIVLIAFIYALVVIFKKCAISFYDIPGTKGLVKGLGWFGLHVIVPPLEWFFEKFGLWVGSGFKFLWMYLVVMKENNCPEIIWEEEKKK